MSMTTSRAEAATKPDKMTVFQQCVSGFNSSHISATEARRLLTDLIHLFYVGETFPESEATQLFFTITKLFQKESVGLKQVIYLAIKELVPLTDNVIMGTSVLMRDVQQTTTNMDTKLYKPMALRALCRILDAGAVESMDRLMRSAIVDRDEVVVCAAIVSSYHLLGISRDTVRRWATETQDALQSAQSRIAQYHALGLLYEMRSQDPMALLKLVVSLADQKILRDNNASALHVRLVGNLLRDQSDYPQLVQILQSYLRHRSDIVSLEAAKTVLRVVKDQNVVIDAIRVLTVFLQSPRPISRFAAIRALCKFADQNPDLVASNCNDTLESLISDGNQSIATYAITTLLKTGSESSVDSLISSIQSNLDEISDDFKLIVVDAVRNLAKRYSSKHNVMLEFFADILRQESDLNLQLSVVEAISDLLDTGVKIEDTSNTSSNSAASANGAGSESGDKSVTDFLLMLCEAIEDADHPEVTVLILHVLGNVAPKSPNARTVVRFINNRVILENTVVRAAAVSALSKFIHVIPDVRNLLKMSLRDPSDEVRDRAAIALQIPIASSDLPDKKFSIPDLETTLLEYLNNGDCEQDLDISNVPRISTNEKAKRRLGFDNSVVEDSNAKPADSVEQESSVDVVDNSAHYAEVLAGIPEIAALGKLLHTSTNSALTDEDMEYIVSYRVHVFEQHIVLQYDVRNNYELDLSNVGVQIDLGVFEEDQLTEEFVLNIPKLKAYESGTVYIGLRRSDMVVGEVPSVMVFDAESVGEEYPLDDLQITPACFITPCSIGSEPFGDKWAGLGNEETNTGQFAIYQNIESAITGLERVLGLLPVEGTGLVNQDATTHTLKMVGKSLSGDDVAATIRLVRSARAGVAGKLQVRSSNPSASFIVAEGF